MKRTYEIIEHSYAFVKNVFERNECKYLFYHNWEHVKIVHAVSLKIGLAEKLSLEDLENLELAALFHDVGYFKGRENHEIASAEMANEFLTKEGFSAERITVVKEIILATKIGTSPKNILEEIIQDADVSHLGSKSYFDSHFNELLKEINTNCTHEINIDEWQSMSLDFMKNHSYNTTYAKANFEIQKQRNILKLINMDGDLDVLSVENTEGSKALSNKKVKKKKKKKSSKGKGNLPEKGVETMFRVAMKNHMSLSQIADNKANTLISVNGIIISIVLSSLFPKMYSNPYLIYPGLTLIFFTVVTIVISILSTIPKTSHGKLSREQVEQKKGNLIFFGNFHKMSLDDYEWGIEELMKDRDYLYKSLTRDLYFLGKVLSRKYTLLRYSYYTFITGLLVSVLIFLISLEVMDQWF